MRNANLLTPLILICAFYLLHKHFERKKSKQKQKEIIPGSNLAGADEIASQVNEQEQTFRNISAEIHDSICLTLSLSKLYISDTADCSQQELSERISTSVELIKKAITDLNRLSKSLSTDALEKFGLIPAIEEQLNDIRNTSFFKAQLVVKGITRQLDANTELMIFRIVQEALNNIIKHAGANSIQIVLAFYETHLTLQIQDNGTGFNINHCVTGSGISNMKKRAHVIKAKVLFESQQPGGTTIKLLVPLNPNSITSCRQIPMLSE